MKELEKIEETNLGEINKIKNLQIKTTRNKLHRFPFFGTKKGLDLPFFSKKRQIAKQEKYLELIERINKKAEENNGKLDLSTVEKVITDYAKELEKPLKLEKPAEPIAIMIKEDLTGELLENMKPGIHEIKRSDGKRGLISIDSRKLITIPWGTDTIKLWILSEKESNALPNSPIADSHMHLVHMESMMANRKDLETQRITAWGTTIEKIGIGIAIIIGVIVFAKIAGYDIIGTILAGLK